MAADRPTSFGELLRRYRVTAGLSQEELAERAGLSVHGISDLERGARQRPYPDTIQRLATALGLDKRATADLQAAGRPRQAGSPEQAVEPTSTRLPEPLTSFVGRDQDLAELQALLQEARLLTLTGVGGIGKTRLALELARGVMDEGATVSFVDLAPLAAPALLPQVVATSLGIAEQPDRPLIDTLVDALQPRRVLLVLDNCEHLVAACAALVAQVLGSCPGCLPARHEPRSAAHRRRSHLAGTLPRLRGIRAGAPRRLGQGRRRRLVRRPDARTQA